MKEYQFRKPVLPQVSLLYILRENGGALYDTTVGTFQSAVLGTLVLPGSL